MTYKLNRYEKNRNHTGDITSIFVSVLITDDTGQSYNMEYWLSPEEMNSVLTDEANLTSILENMSADGSIKLDKYIATKPMEPIIGDKIKKDSFIIDKEKVDSKKVEKLKDEIKELINE